MNQKKTQSHYTPVDAAFLVHFMENAKENKFNGMNFQISISRNK